ncbi:hypothetical protein Tco_0822635 [Tanacetum coccineum]|uniref:DUF1995 domain-containing protein n=1 Tax=Tanacetum coccineum TaxID=301880 RepID=A0ABQ5AGP1_9ASTR
MTSLIPNIPLKPNPNKPQFISNIKLSKPIIKCSTNLSLPPKSKQEAINQAKTCISTTLEKPINNLKLTGKLKKLKQPRFRVEIPVIDDSPESLSELAQQLFDEMPIKKKGSKGDKVKVLIVWPNEKVVLGSGLVEHVGISELVNMGDGVRRVLSGCDFVVFLSPEVAQVGVMESVSESVYPKPVLMFNPRWGYDEEEESMGEFKEFLGSFEVIYSFMGLEVKGLLSKRNGVVFKCVRDGVLSGERWSVLVEEEGELKVVSRFKTRPSIGEVENVLYNLMAINSTITKSAKFLKGLVSNVTGKK